MSIDMLIKNIIKIKMKTKKIALIGLGYVGLPLTVEFAKKRAVIGFDINNISCTNRIIILIIYHQFT